MVTLALLDPIDLTIALQWWDFEDKTEITIGRSSRNDVVIKDPRISRHHVLLSRLHSSSPDREEWQLTNQGKNSVSLNGRVTFRDLVPNGGEIQLAPNGPRLYFFLGDQQTAEQNFQEFTKKFPSKVTVQQDSPKVVIPPPPPEILAIRNIEAIEEKIQDNPKSEECQHLDANPHHLFCGNCGHPLRILRSIRQYDLLKILSEGEDAYTFLAWIPPQHREFPDVLSHSLVVIKQLNPKAAKSLKDQELFMRQAMTLNQLDYPSIPHFLDFFVEAHQFYLVMEWIPGRNLSDHIREQGPLTPDKAITCGLQVCNVLEYLQQQNPPLIHRDIKPANLVLRYHDGRIVLVDFGVVKLLGGAEQTRLALSGYRAPEQLHGQAFPQSDFFSLGSTLLYLLTGRDPSRIHQYQTQTAKYYESVVPGISLPFAEVLRCLLHPNPRDRYQSIKQIKEGLKLAQQSSRVW